MAKDQIIRIKCDLCKKRRIPSLGMYTITHLLPRMELQLHSQMPICKQCSDTIIEAALKSATIIARSLSMPKGQTKKSGHPKPRGGRAKRNKHKKGK